MSRAPDFFFVGHPRSGSGLLDSYLKGHPDIFMARKELHYFGSDLLSKSIFTRKIQLVRNNKKIAEIKGIINEVEVWPNETLEWWFVPIKTGIFFDLKCNVKDQKTLLRHYEMGMKGKIVIK